MVTAYLSLTYAALLPVRALFLKRINTWKSHGRNIYVWHHESPAHQTGSSLPPKHKINSASSQKRNTGKPKHHNPCTVVMGLIRKSDSDWCTGLGFLCSHQKLRLPNNRVTIECFLRPSVKIQKSWNMDSLSAPTVGAVDDSANIIRSSRFQVQTCPYI